jgi:hypothetical protein
VYRRGRTVIALNNDTVAVTVRLPLSSLGDDVLGVCARPRQNGGEVVIEVPRRAGCIF